MLSSLPRALGELETVKVELTEKIATLTINRPKALNALSATVVAELTTAMVALKALVPDDKLRCLIVTGGGDKAFVAGADIAGMVGMGVEQSAVYAKATHDAFELIENFPTPVLAAVNGFALGGGCELAMSCDTIYASDRAKFGQPEVKLGLMPGFAGTVRLPRRVGMGAASEWMYTGALYSAEEAASIGLVHKVLPADELMPHVRRIAEAIASQAPLAVQATKVTMVESVKTTAAQAAANEIHAFSELFPTEDAKEGIAAFVGKRAAVWKGK